MIPNTAPDTVISVSEERFGDHLELLSEMSRDFAECGDIELALRNGLARIADYMDAEGGALFLLNGKDNEIECKACVGPVDITGLTLPPGKGIVGRCVETGYGEIVRDVSKDPSFQGDVDAKTGFQTRSILCAPIAVKDEHLGAIEVLNKKEGDGLFSPSDLNMLIALGASAGLAIVNARMAAELVEKERVQRELELAAQIQRSLLPSPGIEGFPVSAVNVPARMVSGDFYDFFTLEDGRIYFCLGDVSGKGIGAALTMAKATSLFHCLGKAIHSPGHLLDLINTEIAETATQGRFVTMAAGLYSPETGEIVLSNAGHEPPLIMSVRGQFSDVPAQAPPLGIASGIAGPEGFPETRHKLDGGAIYIFTDGLTEGYLADGSELGTEGLKERLLQTQTSPHDVRIDAVIGLIHRGGAPLRDDLTILVLDDADAASSRPDHVKQLPNQDMDEEGDWLVDIRLPTQPVMLRIIRRVTEQSATLCGCDEKTAQDIVIAVDEACQNVIRHAYDGEAGELVLSISKHNDNMVVRLRDFAPPVDVSKIKPRDLDDLRPGGLGTHFIKEIMDNVEFLVPADGEPGNVLRMEKRIG